MTRITLDSIRSCLEGVIPSSIATCSEDGTPNVALLSQVHYVDQGHVALTFQFFNKTRENILANPRAMVQVVDPVSAAHYRLSLEYLRTETSGPLFEHMKARLSSIAAHTGMSKVFRLLGADVYRVHGIEGVSYHGKLSCLPPQYNRLAALRAVTRKLTQCRDPGKFLDELLSSLQQDFQIRHAMILMYDIPGNRLFTIASCGYATSGIGSEIPMGAGIIGVAARECIPIRIMYMSGEYSYSRAIRESFNKDDKALEFETEIPFPGMATPHSQLAVPIVLEGHLLGLLYVESMEELRFTHEDEDALVSLSHLLALEFRTHPLDPEAFPESAPQPGIHKSMAGQTIAIRHYEENDSIFLDGDYLIKGVAGAIFWKVLNEFKNEGRTVFSNRELRLDPSIGLPDIADNLEARLILLQKRLAERCSSLCLEKIGRGRFRLCVQRPVVLEEIAQT